MSESDAAPPRLPKPESLEAKFKLAISLPYDARAKRKHMLVYGFILDWFHSKYGDALASVRHVADKLKERDPAGRGLYIGDIHEALTDLVAWGYLEQEKGSGRRASRYQPVWDSVCSVRENANTKDKDTSVRENGNTSVRENPNATADSVSDIPNEDPLTVTRPKDPGTGKSNVSAAADAPAAIAPGAAAGFDRCWQAYGKLGNKRAAREAWAALPGGADVRHIVARASAWAASAKPGQKRMSLEKWLADEKYDEADRRPLPSLPKVRKGATRRDAEIEEVIFDDRFVIVRLKWNDARVGEKEYFDNRMSTEGFADMLTQLCARDASDIEYRRVLADFWIDKDEQEFERWYRYPDELNDNLPRESDDDHAVRSIHWKEAA